MKIRSVTCFYNPASRQAAKDLARAGAIAREAAKRIQNRGFEVQNLRLATTPFPDFLNLKQPAKAIQAALKLETESHEEGFASLSLGPALPEVPESYPIMPDILAATKDIFLGGVMAEKKKGVSLPAVKACADMIHKCATLSPDGFANLRFAALANVKPFAPFFPAAYQKGSRIGFALAIECADLALMAFTRPLTLAAARASLLKTLQDYARVLTGILEEVAQKYEAVFHGIDYSLAPYPQAWCSLGSAIERLGPPRLGMSGSLAAAAYIADLLDRGDWKRIGFNGLMLPVLEDSTLAQRTSEGILTLKDLLLYSAVCGTGLDTVPLPGETSVPQLYAILLDLAALAVRLGKPLTARLMPIPGKSSGDPTAFTFSYFANGKVMSAQAAPLQGGLAGDETFTLYPRKPDAPAKRAGKKS
jgi:uncharacterized protein